MNFCHSQSQLVLETQCNHFKRFRANHWENVRSRGFFHVDRTSHVQQVLETQCNHFRDYEPTVERTSGPRGFLSCWSSARNTTHSFQEITSQTLREAHGQKDFFHIDRTFISNDYEPDVLRRSVPRWFFAMLIEITRQPLRECEGQEDFVHVDRTPHVQQVLEIQCFHFKRYEPDVERRPGQNVDRNNKILEHNAIISRDFEPTVERTSGSRGFFHVDRTSHRQQVLETQCNHFRDYEPTVERTSGPRGFFSCWSSARNTTHSFQEITSRTLKEGHGQKEFFHVDRTSISNDLRARRC